MNYENKIERLNEILKTLETEDISIENSIKLYSEAEELYKDCATHLNSAKGNIFKIKKDLEKFSEENM